MDFRKILFAGPLCCLLFFSVFGCQSNEQSPDKLAPAKKKVPKVAAVKKSVVEAPVEQQAPSEYAYDPAGRRDPFVPLMEVKRAIVNDDGPLTPLQTFEIGQLRLSGVIVGHDAPMAMVMIPGGKSYIIRKGDKVGKNHGTVTSISESGVLVRERFYDFSGVIRENVQEISLPKRSGVD
jgi:type IV pilus assembly protein PilP